MALSLVVPIFGAMKLYICYLTRLFINSGNSSRKQVKYFVSCKEKEMLKEDTYIEQIKENISVLDPYLVLLFGSYANGSPSEDSDLDIFVVLNEDFMPTTFKERQALYLKVSPYLRSITQNIPIDLLVFTKPMFEHFKASNTNFAKEILNNSITIYESKHSAMA